MRTIERRLEALERMRAEPAPLAVNVSDVDLRALPRHADGRLAVEAMPDGLLLALLAARRDAMKPV